MIPEFESWPKIHRLKGNGIIVTEKIDGTNAQVYVSEDGEVVAGSRSRWITPDSDNFGFARFVAENEEHFQCLGPGRHYGEWWGPGIQRGYGLRERVFSLFNVSRWRDVSEHTGCDRIRCVPVLYEGEWTETIVSTVEQCLRETGSKASPGFMRPEGFVLFHRASQHKYKHTLEGNKK